MTKPLTIVEKLKDSYSFLGDPLHREAWEEIERLREENAKWKKLDSEAAEYVECVICMKSRHFTGNPPYVGWKGLGLALMQDYDDMKRLREGLQSIANNSCCGTCQEAALVAKRTLEGNSHE